MKKLLSLVGFFCLCFGVACAETQDPSSRPWASIQTRMRNSVIQVFSAVVEFSWMQPYRPQKFGEARGTGFFIDERGYFLTNAHVISQARRITVQIPEFGRERFDASIVGVSFDRDLALLRIDERAIKKIKEALGALPVVTFGSSSLVRRGDEVMALGYPLGQEDLKSTVGVVSGYEELEIDAKVQQYFQVDAAINPGNSGGPTVNIKGEVVGINTAGAPNAQSVGFIVPIDEVKVVLDDLYKRESSNDKILRKPYLGMVCRMGSSELNTYLGNPMGGLYVSHVYPNSALYAAGMRKGDVLQAVNGIAIDHYGQLKVSWCEDRVSLENYFARLKRSDNITFTVYRVGQKQEITIPFDQALIPTVRMMHPEFESIDYEIIGGLIVMELAGNHIFEWRAMFPWLLKYLDKKDQFKSVLVVTHIFPGSVAQRARTVNIGVQLKDVNGQKVTTIKELRDALLKDKKAPFVRLHLSDGTLAVFDLKRILAEEPYLAATYHYDLSPAVQDLLKG